MWFKLLHGFPVEKSRFKIILQLMLIFLKGMSCDFFASERSMDCALPQFSQ